MTTHLLNVALRTAGRLAARGVLSTSEAAAFIADAWRRNSHEAMPAGSTSNAWAAATFAQAVACDYWCRECETYRTDQPGGLCPVCSPTRRGAA